MTRPPKPTSLTDGVEIPDLLRVDGGEHPLLRRVLFSIGAAVCLVLGIVGWLVPVVTGVPFYVLGAVLLAKAVPSFGHWLNAKERGWSLRHRLWLRPRLAARLRHERQEREERERAAAAAGGDGAQSSSGEAA